MSFVQHACFELPYLLFVSIKASAHIKLCKRSMGVASLSEWPCLHFLLCDRLKFESRDSAANPVRLCHTRKCGAEWSQQPNCFPSCEHAASVGKRKQERSIRRRRNGSYFSFQSTAQSVEIQETATSCQCEGICGAPNNSSKPFHSQLTSPVLSTLSKEFGFHFCINLQSLQMQF